MLTRLLLATAHDADFVAPDEGPARTPYACTFHWFRVTGGRVVGMDVIRSDDSGRRGLRVFVFEPDGAVRALIHEAPSDAWAPFETTRKPALDGGTNVVARGRGWVTGAVRAAGASQTLARVRFDLDVSPEAPGVGVRAPLGGLLRLRATDYLEARTRGFIELDGERVAVDARGPVSIHHGLRLTRYGYVAAIPAGPEDARLPRLVAATVGGDSLRAGGGLLGPLAITYALGDGDGGGLPARALRVGRPARDPRLGGGRRLLLDHDDVHAFPHALLGEPTVTAIARAQLVSKRGGAPRALTVVLDNRGQPFASLLAPRAYTAPP